MTATSSHRPWTQHWYAPWSASDIELMIQTPSDSLGRVVGTPLTFKFPVAASSLQLTETFACGFTKASRLVVSWPSLILIVSLVSAKLAPKSTTTNPATEYTARVELNISTHYAWRIEVHVQEKWRTQVCQTIYISSSQRVYAGDHDQWYYSIPRQGRMLIAYVYAWIAVDRPNKRRLCSNRPGRNRDGLCTYSLLATLRDWHCTYMWQSMVPCNELLVAISTPPQVHPTYVYPCRLCL